MKRTVEILLFIPILFFVSLNMGAGGTKDTGDYLCKSLELLPDSIKEIVSDRKFIMYDYGHRGKKWCLIYGEGDSYNFKIGSTWNESLDTGYPIDTTRLMTTHRDLISWGIDTLPYVTKDMVWQYPEQWPTFYRSLSVFNQQSNCIFDSQNAIGFEGYDNDLINKKFQELCYFMYFLSAPEIRHLLPGFDDYIK